MDRRSRALNWIAAAGVEVLVRLASWSWWRIRLAFTGLDWLGKLFAIAAALYAFGWTLGNLGLHGLGRELGHAGWTVLSVALTGAIIRHIWSRYTRPSRYSGWTRR